MKEQPSPMQVFISYASEDRAVAQDVQMALSGIGYDVFLDSNVLAAGGDYHAQLREAVAHTDVFVFMISADSIAPRKYTLTELKYARQRWAHPKGRVLPVMVRPVSLSALPIYLKAVTILEPEGSIAAEVAQAVSGLLPKRVRMPRRREVRKSDPSPFLRYLDREMAMMAGLIVVSLLLVLVGLVINRAYQEVWTTGWLHVLAGAAMAVLAAACFYGQLSHLTWIYGQIQLAYTRSDATTEDLDEWLFAVDAWNAWVSYRAGLMITTVSISAYAYAIVAAVVPALRTLLWLSFWGPLILILLTIVVNWYVSTRFPRAEEPVREWLDGLLPSWLRRRASMPPAM